MGVATFFAIFNNFFVLHITASYGHPSYEWTIELYACVNLPFILKKKTVGINYFFDSIRCVVCTLFGLTKAQYQYLLCSVF